MTINKIHSVIDPQKIVKTRYHADYYFVILSQKSLHLSKAKHDLKIIHKDIEKLYLVQKGSHF